MPLTANAKNRALDYICTRTPTSGTIAWMSLHSADPGTTGANELTTGSNPSYARQAATFGTAAASGQISTTAEATFTLNQGATVTHVGFWTNQTGGTFMGWADVADESFANNGTYKVTQATIQLIDS